MAKRKKKKASELPVRESNRLGSHNSLGLQQRVRPNVEETTAVQIWRRENGEASILYDPWCVNTNAQVVHGHYHTSWARNIFFNHRDGIFKKPALFDWTGKTVYIVGRGASAGKNVDVLNSVERKNPAIFVSSAYVMDMQPVDFAMIADNRILVPGHAVYKGAVDNPLLTFPGIDGEIVKDNWRGVYGFNPWTQSPLNNFMREIFPHLPSVLDILCTSVMASHLACLNGAANIVYLGMDNTIKGTHKDLVKTKDIHGNKVKSMVGYMEMQTALAQFAGLARFHCETKFINATGEGVLGVNFFEGETLFPWIEQTTMEDATERFEVNGAELKYATA